MRIFPWQRKNRFEEFIKRLQDKGFAVGEPSSDHKRPIFMQVGEVGPKTDACFVYHRDDEGRTPVQEILAIIAEMKQQEGITVSLSIQSGPRMVPSG